MTNLPKIANELPHPGCSIINVTVAKSKGRHIVGIMCEYTPRELIMAADAVPVCLCGGSAEMIPPAEEHLPVNLCPLIKSTYGYHIQKANPFLEMADLIMINMERRKRVMQRSIKLGHYICDPKQPCPCDLFKQKNICQCAGERLDSPAGPVQLTKLVEKAGCASKIDQAFLKQVLKDLPAVDDPRVLVGVPAGDDAGSYYIPNTKCVKYNRRNLMSQIATSNYQINRLELFMLSFRSLRMFFRCFNIYCTFQEK